MTLGKIIGIVFLIFILGGIIVFYFMSNASPEESLVIDPINQNRTLTIYETDPYKGKIDAPISVVMVGSFTCPGCQKGSVLMDQLLALYPDDVKIIWKDLPESAGASYEAAVAARCAQQQGRFWQYHDRLFRKQAVIGSDELFIEWAGDLGMQTEIFATCMNNRSTRSLVERSINDALVINVEQVPYYEVNERYKVDSAPSLAVFQSLIDGIIDAR